MLLRPNGKTFDVGHSKKLSHLWNVLRQFSVIFLYFSSWKVFKITRASRGVFQPDYLRLRRKIFRSQVRWSSQDHQQQIVNFFQVGIRRENCENSLAFIFPGLNFYLMIIFSLSPPFSRMKKKSIDIDNGTKKQHENLKGILLYKKSEWNENN